MQQTDAPKTPGVLQNRLMYRKGVPQNRTTASAPNHLLRPKNDYVQHKREIGAQGFVFKSHGVVFGAQVGVFGARAKGTEFSGCCWVFVAHGDVFEESQTFSETRVRF